MAAKGRVPVTGSERLPLPGSRIVGAADPHERLSVTLLLRRRPSSPGLAAAIEASGQPQHLTREAFAQAHGADPADVAKIEAFAHEHHLDVVDVKPAERRIVVSGIVSDVSAAFGVYLARYESPQGAYRGRTGPAHVPEDLGPIVQGVFGLDNRPQATPKLRLLDEGAGAAASRAKSASYTPPQVAKLYDFPTGVNGSGQCIAIIELGGGYRTTDLNTYFHQLGLSTPIITSRSVDGGHNHPTLNANGPDGEVMLDIEVAGAVAPGAKIVVYFAPNTDAGFLDAISTAVHDTTNHPSVVSISWGGPEKEWTQQAMQAMDQAFQDAAALGVTVCCASGDAGSGDGESDGLAHVDFPSSSPYALACGGTRLEGSGSTISTEIVWNESTGGASGGGVSDVFGLPSWQAHAGVPKSANPGGRVGRGVPDVAGDADPYTGYQVRVDGRNLVIGGTSAVAPLWAGLIALANQKLKHPAGYLNPKLYSLPSSAKAFRDITSGNNGAYQARSGWDPCTGLGSPDGAKLATALGT